MVLGIDSFKEKFKNYTAYYTIIGGTACDILLTEADINVGGRMKKVCISIDLQKESLVIQP